MSSDNPLHTMNEDLLHAYADGQLPPSERSRVESFLAANPDKAAEVADWMRQNAMLEAMFPSAEAKQHVRQLPIPITRKAANSILPPIRRVAAILALVSVGLGGGWLARGAVEQGVTVVEAEIVREAMMAHTVYSSEVLHPVEVAADQESHLVGWLSKRLGAEIVAPDLSEAGFELIGGRLLPAGQGPAAQFMYEDANGRRITIYATGGSPGVLASFQYERDGDVRGIYWQDETLRYAVVGELPRDELTTLATAVYRQLI
ncbi:MAG TPA: anti-sigma factor [Rhodobacteraceae bacterium]|nr:anti-sigma factor [Paracoccaceae bacterium]